jgi:ubiquinone/menaquinone biosynthesis C-methylase UbiE
MGTDAAADELPAYAEHLTAFHRACRRELARAVRDVPVPAGGRVLDLPCGDGFYSLCFARRLAAGGGSVVAADLSPAFLRLARRVYTRGRRPAAPVEFVSADAYALPFPDDSFDAVWCAQSLITFADDPVTALREMRRVVRPGGAVAVLENDEFHHVLVNWPVGLELAVQQAVAAAAVAKYGGPAKLSPARGLRRLFGAAGLTPVWKRTYAADRTAPFDRRATTFLAGHLAETRRLIAPHLSADALAAFDRFADPDGPESVFRRPDADFTCLNTLFVARK